LTYHPIVAELAAKIAASRRNRHNQSARVKVRERFLAYGVDSGGYSFLVIKREERASLVLPNQTKASCAVVYEASARAQMAFNFFFALFFVEHCFMQ
jgi:hypothetical protein